MNVRIADRSHRACDQPRSEPGHCSWYGRARNVMQPVFCLAYFFAVLSLAGCASAPEPVAPISDPPPPAAVQPAVPPAPTEKQVIASVRPENNVFFEQGSSDIDEAGLATLRIHAERLKANRKKRLTLIGHAESFGSRALAIAIAEKRVDAVYTQLRAYGVPSRQLLRANMGIETNSKACQSQDCRSLMRRVELRYAKVR